MGTSYEKFLELIKPFAALWNSARVTCVAVGDPFQRKSVTTRITLREEELPKGQDFRKLHWLEPVLQVLIAVVDFPKSTASQILFKAIDKYEINLETHSTVDRALLRWPLPGDSVSQTQPPRLAGWSWHEPVRYEKPWAGDQVGENRTCLALAGMGEAIRDVMPHELWRDVSSKLRRDPPHFDGIEGFYDEFLPGLSRGPLGARFAQVVFPLPLDMEQAEDGRILLRAPNVAEDGQMRIVLNFAPTGPPKELQATRSTGEPTGSGRKVEWRQDIPWPPGAESAKASLFYAGEEVSSIDVRRWLGAGDLRGAIDSYFDPDHKLLHEDLFGKNEKKSRAKKPQHAFEMAVVRLMNLLGIPLVWYGEGGVPRRSDAAGLVDGKGKRVVVLVECTVEKPEAKFSALRERSQQLAESLLGGEADVLPVVFTPADPPESMLDTARDHGVALVTRSGLSSLFAMLNGTAQERDALNFLDLLRRGMGIPGPRW